MYETDLISGKNDKVLDLIKEKRRKIKDNDLIKEEKKREN